MGPEQPNGYDEGKLRRLVDGSNAIPQNDNPDDDPEAMPTDPIKDGKDSQGDVPRGTGIKKWWNHANKEGDAPKSEEIIQRAAPQIENRWDLNRLHEATDPDISGENDPEKRHELKLETERAVPEGLTWTELNKDRFVNLVDLIRANEAGYGVSEGSIVESPSEDRRNNKDLLEVRFEPVLNSISSLSYRCVALASGKYHVEAKVVGKKSSIRQKKVDGYIQSVNEEYLEKVSFIYEAIMDQKPEI